MSVNINQIIGEAAEKLRDRERRLEAIIEPAQAELREIRKALKRLTGEHGGSKGSARTGGASSSAMDPAEKRRRVREVLEAAADGDPLPTVEIAALARVPAQGLHLLLAHMKRDGIVAEPEKGLWLSTKAPRFDTSRSEPRAAA